MSAASERREQTEALDNLAFLVSEFHERLRFHCVTDAETVLRLAEAALPPLLDATLAPRREQRAPTVVIKSESILNSPDFKDKLNAALSDLKRQGWL